MKVAEWLRLHPGNAVTVSPDASFAAVLDRLLDVPGVHDVYVVAPGGRVVGHLSRHRLARMRLAEHRPSRTRRQLMEQVAGGVAREIMNPHFPAAAPDEDLDNVLHRQLEQEIEDMPVLDEQGALLGTINLTAVLREMRRQEREGEDAS